MTEKKLLKESTVKKWEETFPWLKFTENNTICEVCLSQKEKIWLMLRINLSFTIGCNNFKLSALQDHQKSEWHSRAVREEEAEKAKLAGHPLIQFVYNKVSQTILCYYRGLVLCVILKEKL